MLPVLLLIVVSASQALAQRPCGFRIAPCPADQICSRTDSSCTRGENCAGICAPGPYYKDMLPATPTHSTLAPTTSKAARRGCGVRMMGGVYNCEADEYCIDNPDRPAGSCGMACDRPGICMKKPTPVLCSGRLGDLNPCGPNEACVCTCDLGADGHCPADDGPQGFCAGKGVCGPVDGPIVLQPQPQKSSSRRAAETILASTQPKPTYTICGGRQKEQPCKKDEECMDKPETPGALAYDGQGICVKKPHKSLTTGIVPTSTPTYERKCGGTVPRGKENDCRKDEICMDDPRRPEGTPGLALDGFWICVK
jgi:hypothetical protein